MQSLTGSKGLVTRVKNFFLWVAKKFNQWADRQKTCAQDNHLWVEIAYRMEECSLCGVKRIRYTKAY
jgi:hypothetical protein